MRKYSNLCLCKRAYFHREHYQVCGRTAKSWDASALQCSCQRENSREHRPVQIWRQCAINSPTTRAPTLATSRSAPKGPSTEGQPSSLTPPPANQPSPSSHSLLIIPSLEAALDKAHGEEPLHKTALVQLTPAHIGTPCGLQPLLQVRMSTEECRVQVRCTDARAGRTRCHSMYHVLIKLRCLHSSTTT